MIKRRILPYWLTSRVFYATAWVIYTFFGYRAVYHRDTDRIRYERI